MAAPLPDGERLARLRLARTDRIGPVTFRELLRRCGSAADALGALPELSRRAGGGVLRPFPSEAAEAELAAGEALGARLLVLGDMGEVGGQGPAFHREVGEYARERGIEQLFTLGEQAVAMGGRHFADAEALNAAVLQALRSAESVLVKGSRFMRMERVVEAIAAHSRQEEDKETPDAR